MDTLTGIYATVVSKVNQERLVFMTSTYLLQPGEENSVDSSFRGDGRIEFLGAGESAGECYGRAIGSVRLLLNAFGVA